MGTLLSYFSNNRWSLQNLLDREENRPFEPRVNKEMTALDVWRAFSMAFIYLACAEFVLVHFLGKRASKRSKVSQLQVLSANLLTRVSVGKNVGRSSEPRHSLGETSKTMVLPKGQIKP